MVKSILASSPAQTKKIGRQLAETTLKEVRRRKFAVVLALEGELGAGKTTFLKGFAKGLGIRGKITSPTFIIIKRYRLQATSYKTFYHIDCYRLKKRQELLILGFKDIVSEPSNIIAMEWAERVKDVLPKNAAKIKFEVIGKNAREIIVRKQNG